MRKLLGVMGSCCQISLSLWHELDGENMPCFGNTSDCHSIGLESIQEVASMFSEIKQR